MVGALPVAGSVVKHMELQVKNTLLVVNDVKTVGYVAFNIIIQITFSNFNNLDTWIRFFTDANSNCVVIIVVVVELEG